MAELLGIDSLFANLTLALGAAMLLGNGFAWIQNHRGRRPEGTTTEFQPRRAAFLALIGLVMTIWGLLSILE